MKPPSRSLLRWRPRWSAFGLACCGALLSLVTPVFAGSDYYLKISDVPGEIATGGFTGWTKLTGLSAEVQRVLPPLPATELVTTVEVHFRKAPGAVSSPLITRCATRQTTPKMVLACVDGTKPVLRITLTDVLVSSFQSSAGEGPPQDDIGCTFRAIEWSYAEHDGATGGNTATFNTATQTGEVKPRVPFRAVLEHNPQVPGGMRLTCPVDAGHRYRVTGNPTLNGPWQPVHEFSAETDGIMTVTFPVTGPLLFLRVEETE